MSGIYVLNSDGSLSHKLVGDTNTMLLNIPDGLSFTLSEPENMFEQKFDFNKGKWMYPESETPES